METVTENEVGAGIRSPADFRCFEFWNLFAIMLAALLRRTCGHCTESAVANFGRAVNLSYSSETLGPLRLVSRLPVPSTSWRAERNIVGAPLGANPGQLLPSGKSENLVVRSSGHLSGIAPDVLNYVCPSSSRIYAFECYSRCPRLKT